MSNFFKRVGPPAAIALGVVLLLVGLWLILTPGPLVIPNRLAGLSLSTRLTGPPALAEIEHLHGKSFMLTDGAVARYNGGNITVWASATWLSPFAGWQVDAMTRRIAEGNSPFVPRENRQVNGHTVYVLSGMGQEHFYFQHNHQVIWLAASAPVADAALTDYIQQLP